MRRFKNRGSGGDKLSIRGLGQLETGLPGETRSFDGSTDNGMSSFVKTDCFSYSYQTGASVSFPDYRDRSTLAANMSESRAVDVYSSLAMLEEPLIDLSTSSSTTMSPPASLSRSSSYMKPLLHGPKTEEGIAWDVLDEGSLLDFGDMNQVSKPARSDSHSTDAQMSQRSASASNLVSRRLPAMYQNTPHYTKAGAALALSHHAARLAPNSRDVIREDDSEICCDDARTGKAQYSFCWPCNTSFCDKCWSHQRAHKKRVQTVGGIPHEPTDPFVAKKIQHALEADLTDTEQAMLHVQDEDTAWFGAWKDEKDDMVFQDYGRYATLMGENSTRQRRLRYPALVSFVGQTGAGKSTSSVC